jgi:hypothetical protein
MMKTMKSSPNQRKFKTRIWLDDSLSGRKITSSLDLTAENKGNIEMLADMQGVVSV